jgi:hypothetical protein
LLHAAQLTPCRRIALGGGFAIPRQRLREIERHVAGTKIIIPKGKLRLCIARGGRREKRVGFNARQGSRLSRSLRRGLRLVGNREVTYCS